MAVIQNRIANGGFELGLFGWNSQDVTIVNDPTNEGFAAALLKGGGLNSSLIQSVQASPGDTFELMLSMTRDTVGTTPLVSVSIAYFNAANTLLGYGLLENIRLPDAAVQVYQTVYGIALPAPSCTVRAQLAIVRLAATGTAAILLDQIVLNQVITDASGAIPVLFPDVPTSDQQSSTVVQLPFMFSTNLLTLNVTTTQPNQRVKIDAFIETSLRPAPGTNFSIAVNYTLRRGNQTLFRLSSEELFGLVDVFSGPVANLNNTIYPNLTFIDVVPNPGTYTYTVAASVEGTPTSSASAGARAIHAIVYPPGA